jgi:hypothetical protein
MAKTLLFAAALLLAGALIGGEAVRYNAARHRHTRAVMALQDFHLGRLDAALRAGHCQEAGLERERLGRVFDELLQAFPLAYAQDREFHKRADALHSALQPNPGGAGACPEIGVDVKKIGDACDDCHNEYR